MPDSRLEIVEDEFLAFNSINYYDEFHANLLFDRSIYRPMCTHLGHSVARRSLFLCKNACRNLRRPWPWPQPLVVAHFQGQGEIIFHPGVVHG